MRGVTSPLPFNDIGRRTSDLADRNPLGVSCVEAASHHCGPHMQLRCWLQLQVRGSMTNAALYLAFDESGGVKGFACFLERGRTVGLE